MTRRLPPVRVAGVVVALLVTAALTAVSRMPVVAHPSPDAMLRLSWTGRPERIEQCRTVTDQELAALPAHMRQQVVCEGVTARYRVDVRRDGRLLASDELRGGGLRGDRQLYHHREIRVPSGRSTIEVRVTRTHPALTSAPYSAAPAANAAGSTGGAGTPDDTRETQARSRRRGDEIPPSLVLVQAVSLEPREVMLVLYDRTTRRLHAVRKD